MYECGLRERSNYNTRRKGKCLGLNPYPSSYKVEAITDMLLNLSIERVRAEIQTDDFQNSWRIYYKSMEHFIEYLPKKLSLESSECRRRLSNLNLSMLSPVAAAAFESRPRLEPTKNKWLISVTDDHHACVTVTEFDERRQSTVAREFRSNTTQ